MSDNLLADSIEQLLNDHSPPHVVRMIEGGASSAALWRTVEESGFCDALLPESKGGAGLGMCDALAIFEACGRHAVPIPLAQTVMARALIADAGHIPPAGSIALATGKADAADVLYGAVADWVLLSDGQALKLLDTKEARHDTLGTVATDIRMHWPANFEASLQFNSTHDLRVIEALVLAAQISGAVRHVFAETLTYANERQQFGRSIGKFQAIQHHFAVLAEQVEAARMSVRMACAGTTPWPEMLLAAVAKARTSEAAVIVASLAHAIHGAMGITEECDLQLHTRRLHAWRIAAGSETYWHRCIGRALVAGSSSIAEFTRQELAATID
ncbi:MULTISPECIES: acyl-CoA dehydrogenase [Cupriavidus]|uniref:acyl-CoA dehydrogenase n=1 Tax=Cupriavidus TaxID=106589 RepID=UPI00157B69B6|nr:MULTISPECIES: acyl-CoA dehydrogenase [Cupriavidus]MBB1632503.1 hypothetical protein [Cupriavidus sp. UME77]NUA27045.1 acyl-CoA dehydrogenase [Cupriavidus basilensis]